MNIGRFKLVNYNEKYGSIMQFNKNKNTYIHGWYPFVEGYSKEFIRSIVSEYQNINNCLPKLCVEPFCGSGTTPLELQKLNVNCKSFEVSPFMYNLSKVKMTTSYTVNSFNKYYNKVQNYLNNPIDDVYSLVALNASRRIVQKEGLDKWNFDKETMDGILDIKYIINTFKNKKYEQLFTIALASILLEVSNVYRNGKCLSYKKNWKDQHFSREDVHSKFFKKLNDVFLPDIKNLNQYKKNRKLLSNAKDCYLGDVRKNLDKKVADNSVDLVITSPPYLNSRDYTDTYMVELRVLDYIKNDAQIRKLRKNTIRSHVQVKWHKCNSLNIQSLKKSIAKLKQNKEKLWNDSLINMIEGYFEDMNTLFSILYNKMKFGGLIFFNVANSSYNNVEIHTDEIISEIAEANGFIVKEIREARLINPSSQQKNSIKHLRESVLVIMK